MRAMSQPIQSAELNATVTVLDDGLMVRLSGTADVSDGQDSPQSPRILIAGHLTTPRRSARAQ